MANKWVCSDLHLGHENIIKFETDGKLIRPGFHDADGFHAFQNIQHHDEMYIARHNDAVKTGDKVYFLGDIGKPLDKIKRLNGKKRLILGNHDDIHDLRDLSEVFDEVVAWRTWKIEEFGYPVVFSHFPLHADERHPAVRRINVHGHIHEKIIKRANGSVDPWYVNVCVEHSNHAPIHFDALKTTIRARISTIKALGEFPSEEAIDNISKPRIERC